MVLAGLPLLLLVLLAVPVDRTARVGGRGPSVLDGAAAGWWPAAPYPRAMSNLPRAQNLSRIVALITEHVEVTPSAVLLRLGQVPAQMPPPLDDHIRTLHAQAMTTDSAGERWLLPGRFPAQHLSRSQLVRRLHPLGVRPRMARNTALVELASELPAVMVSRLLGIHHNTADSWKRIGGQDNAYAADVASRHQPTTP
ncbi:hypothetical protein ACIBTP_37045 [Streptomyces avidinii]|uniref:hypothetical protein n=1 Tax=Streptomyces avidinii TaxID=1895 RepID=UPI0037AB6C9D